MPFEVGGSRAWRSYRKGDLIAALHWIDHNPAMLIASSRGRAAYAVPLSTAHQYARSDGYPEPEACARLAADVAEHLGIGADKRTLYRVTEIFLDALPDLVAMPPEPDWNKVEHNQRHTVGELVLKDGGRVIREVELKEGFGA